MAAVGFVDDALKGLWTFFRGKPDFKIPPTTPAPTLPRVDPAPPPLRPPIGPRVPRIPPTGDTEAETGQIPDTAADPAPETQTEDETTTTTEELQECETCPDCEPRRQGHSVFRTLTGTEASNLSGAQYQSWVIPWFRWVGNQIEEWEFQTDKFDRIDQTICQLIEAKGKYGLYFRNPDGLRIEPYHYAQVGPLKKDIAEFERQHAKIAPYDPQVTLHWVMHTWAYYIFMSPIIQGTGYLATTEHRPYPEWSVND